MNITGKQVSECTGYSYRHIQRLTKQANDKGLSVIECNGEKFLFSLTHNNSLRGKAYSYQQVIKQATKPKRKVKPSSTINPADLPTIADSQLKRFTTDEKIALITFYNTSQINLGVIVKTLIMQHHASIKTASLQAKIKRWVSVFKKKGRSGLEDKRGGKAFKSDLEMVKSAIFGAGSRTDLSAYLFYCFLYAKKHGINFSVKNPVSDVSESAFIRATKHVIKTNHLVAEYLRVGKQAFVNAKPSMGNVWAYPNEQWEVDATPLDLMIRIPLDEDGFKDFSSRNTQADYETHNLSDKNARVTLVRLIDNYSKSTVHMITESSNSNANARLLYKAFAKLGMPEIIRSDRGSDYISAHLQGLIEDLKILSIILPPASGDKKGTIERTFRTLQHSAEFESLPGFIGHNVHQRQHLENEASTKRDKKSNVATNITGDFLWHWEVENWIENYLAHKDVKKYAMHEGSQLNDLELQKIYRRLGKKHSKKIHRDGISHNSIKYLDNDLWQKDLVIGEHITVHDNIDDTTKLFLFRDDQYLGEVTASNVFMQSQTAEESKATQKAYKQRANKHDRQVMSDAQKEHKGFQNIIRDEYLDKAVASQKVKKTTEKEAEKTGFNELAEYAKIAQLHG